MSFGGIPHFGLQKTGVVHPKRGFEHFVEKRRVAAIEPFAPADLFLAHENPRKPLSPHPFQQCHRDAGVFGYVGHFPPAKRRK
jgi:hypothetical protein